MTFESGHVDKNRTSFQQKVRKKKLISLNLQGRLGSFKFSGDFNVRKKSNLHIDAGRRTLVKSRA